MAPQNRALAPSFESICTAVSQLEHQEKVRLWQLLETEIGLVEEAVWERDSGVQSEIREARAAYDSKDYVTLEDYLTDLPNGPK